LERILLANVRGSDSSIFVNRAARVSKQFVINATILYVKAYLPKGHEIKTLPVMGYQFFKFKLFIFLKILIFNGLVKSQK